MFRNKHDELQKRFDAMKEARHEFEVCLAESYRQVNMLQHKYSKICFEIGRIINMLDIKCKN